MGFVDHHQRNLQLSQLLNESLVREAFRRHVEQLQSASSEIGVGTPDFLQINAGIQSGRWDFSRSQEIDLVLHQGDERRNDEGQTWQMQRAELVTKAFTAAGREDR